MSITVSIGLAAFRPGERLSEALRRADAALYAVKNTGRNGVRGEDEDQRPR
jgi:diguanylate cyclase